MTELRNTVLRKEYIRKLDTGRDRTDFAKVVTGIRRSGKSTLMKQYMEHLRESGVGGDRIFYINMEAEENLGIADYRELQEIIKENIRKDVRTYVFLDEVQRIKGWEMNLNALMESYDADVYITGSNAYLLSSELSTYISGRYVEIGMLPLSFSEYLELHPSFKTEGDAFASYLRYGALPLIDPKADTDLNNDLLEGIYNTILVKDVLSRLDLRSPRVLEKIMRFLYSNVGNLTNVSTIAEHLGISPTTAGKYMKALEDAYIIYGAERYDVRGKKILNSVEKYYAADTGMRNAVTGWSEEDLWKLLENSVYLELRRRGYNVKVGSFKDAEIDFTAFKGDDVEYYQVTITMLPDEVSEREIRALNMAKDNYPKTILSLDEFKVPTGNGIKHLNLIDWLLGRDRSAGRFRC